MELTIHIAAVAYDRLSKSWRIKIGPEVETLIDPSTDDEEHELAWYLEQHSLVDPFSLQRAQAVRQRLKIYRLALSSLLQPYLRRKLEESRERVETVYFNILDGPNVETSIQKIHWELLEDVSVWEDCDIKSIIFSRLVPWSGSGSQRKRNPQRFNMLLLSARPKRSLDNIPYRLISKPVWDIATMANPSVVPHIVRPGTWGGLKRSLEAHDYGFYTLIHLDLHGIIDRNGNAKLQFQGEMSSRRRAIQKTAQEVGQLLACHGVQIAVLNSCSSSKSSDCPAGNLASTLISCGVERVIGMSFDVLSSSALIFCTSFYDAFLVQGLDFARAVSFARKAMRMDLNRPGRFGGPVEIEDSLTPVLYRRSNFAQSYKFPTDVLSKKAKTRLLPSKATTNDIGVPLIGRDGDLLELEHTLQMQSVINIAGQGGIGKTAFLAYATEWWRQSMYAKIIEWVAFGDLFRRWRRETPLLDHQPGHINLNSSPSEDYNFDYIAVIDNVDPRIFNIDDFMEAFAELTVAFQSANRTRLIILSQLPIEQDLLGNNTDAVALGPLSDIDANILARRILTKSEIEVGKGSQAASELRFLLKQHNNNPLFMELFLPMLSRFENSPRLLAESLALDILLTSPERLANEAHDIQGFASPSLMARSDILSSMSELVEALSQQNQLAYWILLSLAPFTGKIPGDFGPYFFRLIQDGILASHMNSTGVARAEGTEQPADLSEKVSITTGSVLYTLCRNCLAEYVDQGPQHTYFIIHPLLPHLLRWQLHIRHDNAATLYKTLVDAFWKYYEIKTKHMLVGCCSDNHSSPLPTELSINKLLTIDRRNFYNAVRAVIRQPDFGRMAMWIVKSLDYIASDVWLSHDNAEYELLLQLLDTLFERYDLMAIQDDTWQPSSDLWTRRAICAQFLFVAIFRGLNPLRIGWSQFLKVHYSRSLLIFHRLWAHAEPTEDLAQGLYTLECYALFYSGLPPLQLQPQIEELLQHCPTSSSEYWIALEGAKVALMSLQIAQQGRAVTPQTLSSIKRRIGNVAESINNIYVSSPEIVSSMFPEIVSYLASLNETQSRDNMLANSELELWESILPCASFSLPLLPHISPRSSKAHGDSTSRRKDLLDQLKANYDTHNVFAEVCLHEELFTMALEENDLAAAVVHDNRILEVTDGTVGLDAAKKGQLTDEQRAVRHTRLGSMYLFGHPSAIDGTDPQGIDPVQAKKYLCSALAAVENLQTLKAEYKVSINMLIAMWEEMFGANDPFSRAHRAIHLAEATIAEPDVTHGAEMTGMFKSLRQLQGLPEMLDDGSDLLRLLQSGAFMSPQPRGMVNRALTEDVQQAKMDFPDEATGLHDEYIGIMTAPYETSPEHSRYFELTSQGVWVLKSEWKTWHSKAIDAFYRLFWWG